MKKILGILTICFVGLFMLVSCGSSKNTSTGTVSGEEQTIQLLCEDCEVTLKVNDRYYLVEYYTDEYITYIKEKTGTTIGYNMRVLSWDEESFEYAKEADPRFCNVYVKRMYILDDFYYIELETKQDVGLCIMPRSTAYRVVSDVRYNMSNESYNKTIIVTTTDYYMLRLPINEVSYTIK